MSVRSSCLARTSLLMHASPSRKRIEALNQLQALVASTRSSVSDKEGLGAKLDKSDKDAINTALKETESWLEENGESATAEDVEEQLSELQATPAPITSKVYGDSAGGSSSSGPTDPDDEPLSYGGHDEL